MQDPTLRTFTLDFYRRQGADATPLDTQRRRWEVRLGDRRFDISFAAGEDAEAIAPGSPRLKEILAECEERGAVSHRHVVVEPIADPAALLLGVAPEGWLLSRVRLERVRTRRVVAFTHRVAYGAGVLPHPIEETHVDILDPVTGMACPALVDALSGTQVLPAEPPRDLPALGPLHARALALVDARTSVRGEALERQLGSRRTESVTRIRRHYGALREDARQREIRGLEERLAKVLGAIKGALPADLAELSREGAEMARRLDAARKGQTVALASLARLEEEAVRAEEGAHEVTLTTELVALHVVSFDEVTYLARFTRPADGAIPTAETPDVRLGYVPVTRQILMPDCGVCGEVVQDPVMTGMLSLACRTCIRACPACARPCAESSDEAGTCTACSVALCPACAAICSDCQEPVCETDRVACGACGTLVCTGCRAVCAADGAPVCHGCRLEAGGGFVCQEHAGTCASCNVRGLAADLSACTVSRDSTCANCLGSCTACGAQVARRLMLEGGNGMFCPDHAGTCRTCFEVVRADDLGSCASCGRNQCGTHRPDCVSCGLPVCAECITEDRCGVCSRLAPLEPADPRFATLARELGLRGIRTLLVAEVAGARVVEWQGLLGRWGRMSWDASGRRVAAYRYGPVTAMMQEVMAQIRPA
ncbi:MAG: hypothetical protein VKO64_01280 [Candidatus Sericytochromatia bacterium]|nr:hypothetical protein [Candidatus Sericytochromatia bacterium]